MKTFYATTTITAPPARVWDILTDAGVPRHLRDRLPLVFADGRLAWVPGIAVDAEAAAVPGEPAQHVWCGCGRHRVVLEAALEAAVTHYSAAPLATLSTRCWGNRS